MKTIILFGRTCSGKGHLLENLLKMGIELDIISPGEFFRSERERDSNIWKTISPYVEKGLHAPDEITNSVVEKFLGTDRGIVKVIDGFPRTMSQARMIISNPSDYYIVYINTPDLVCASRLTSRGRHDDNPRAFHNKMREFDEVTLPVMRVLQQEYGLIEIEGMKADNQFAEVIKYCGLESLINPLKADDEVLKKYIKWAREIKRNIPLSEEDLQESYLFKKDEICFPA